MANKVTLTAQDGSAIEFYDEIKAQGGVKDVYFSTDKTYVVDTKFNILRKQANTFVKSVEKNTKQNNTD